MTTNFSEDTVRQVFKFLAHEIWTEIRVINPNRDEDPKQFFIAEEDEFVKICRQWSGKRNIYVGINDRKVKSGKGKDVHSVKTVVIDIDAKRPDKKQPATDEELKHAEVVADQIIEDFTKRGFQRPIKNMSGNGYQLWCAIPIIDFHVLKCDVVESKIQQFQKGIKVKYENAYVEIDNIGDLPRIIKVIGTKSVKGENTKERPHRLSFCCDEKFERCEDPLLRDYILAMELPRKTTTAPQPTQPLPDDKVMELINRSRFRDCFLVKKARCAKGADLQRAEVHVVEQDP